MSILIGSNAEMRKSDIINKLYGSVALFGLIVKCGLLCFANQQFRRMKFGV